MKIVALAGGVGGAKLAHGLAQILSLVEQEGKPLDEVIIKR